MVTIGFGLVVTALERFPFPNTDRALLTAMAICADCVIGLAVAVAIMIAA